MIKTSIRNNGIEALTSIFLKGIDSIPGTSPDPHISLSSPLAFCNPGNNST
jgi:hypothetical protein